MRALWAVEGRLLPIDKELKEACVAWRKKLGDGPAEPVETNLFTLEEAAKAERCEPAKLRFELWNEGHGRVDLQKGLFDG